MSDSRSKIIAVLVGGAIGLGAIVGISYFRRKHAKPTQTPEVSESESEALTPAMEDVKQNVFLDVLITDSNGVSVYNGNMDRNLEHLPIMGNDTSELHILCALDEEDKTSFSITLYKEKVAVTVAGSLSENPLETITQAAFKVTSNLAKLVTLEEEDWSTIKINIIDIYIPDAED